MNDIPIIGAGPELTAILQPMVNEVDLAKPMKPRRRPKPVAKVSERRLHERFDISIPATCFPVKQSHELDSGASLPALVSDISLGGMKLQLSDSQPPLGTELVFAVQNRGAIQFTSGEVVRSIRGRDGLVTAGIRFSGYVHELLQNEEVLPELNMGSMRYELPCPEPILTSLCDLGAAAMVELDEIIVCPFCQAVPTLRYGCNLCLSHRVKTSRMIHHFACANVDFVEKFEQGDELVCQKCRARKLIVGADYEYLDGPARCQDCGQTNLEPIAIGHCLGCENRFNLKQANNRKMYGYRVKRLDALALVDPA